MSESIRSKLSMQSGRVVPSAVLVSCFALPVLLSAVTGCSGDPNASQVDGAAGNTTGAVTGVAGGPDLMPIGQGGSSNGTGGTGNSVAGAGPYALPADYTKATKGGFKLGDPVDVGSAGGSTGAAGASSGCGTAIMGVVRDFKGASEQGGHKDFEAFSGRGASKGIVKAVLGDDQKPVYNGTGPIVDSKNGQQTTSKENFDQWYRGTKDVNQPFQVFFYFEPNGDVLTFQSSAFFPLDGKGWGNTPKWPHNYNFTTEVHTQFAYKGGETFSFTGDDDLWVFINRKLAIDLGGLHPETSAKISLDEQAAKLGIQVGGTYDLDLFHAERHTDQSNFRVDTNLAFTNCGTIIEEPPIK